jgi:hypothetical protein
MDLRTRLTRIKTIKQKIQLADYLVTNKVYLNKIIDIYCTGPDRITQQAANPLEWIARTKPAVLIPYVNRLVKALAMADVNTSMKRNTLRIFQFMDLPQKFQGQIVTLCFKYLEDPAEPIAVKVFSMSTLHRQAGHSPELMRELKLVLEHQLPYGSAGFRSRANKVMAAISNRYASEAR